MDKQVSLVSERLLIKTMRLEDITPEYIEALNDPEVNEFLVGARIQKQTQKTVEEYVLHNLKSPQDLMLGFYLKKPRVFIGTMRIGDISNFHYSCTIGICLFNKKYWKQGYALEALKKAVDFIFQDLKLHYIEAGVYKGNFSSMKLFERAGFNVQAVYKDKYRYDFSFKEATIFTRVSDNFDFSLLKRNNYGR